MNCDLVWESEAAAAAPPPATLPTPTPPPRQAAAPLEGDHVAILFAPTPQPLTGAAPSSAAGRHVRAPSAFDGAAPALAAAQQLRDVTELAAVATLGAGGVPWSSKAGSTAGSASPQGLAAPGHHDSSPRPQLALQLSAQSPTPPALRVVAPASLTVATGAAAGASAAPWLAHAGSPPPPLPPVALAAPIPAASPATDGSGGASSPAQLETSPARRGGALVGGFAAGRRGDGASPPSRPPSGRRQPSAV